MNTSLEGYISVVEAADRLRVMPSDIERWARQGKLPAISNVDGELLIWPEDLALVLEPASRRRPRK